MFVRAEKSGPDEYLRIVVKRRIKDRVVRRGIRLLGRLDQLREKSDSEGLGRSLAGYSEQVLSVLSGKSEVVAHAAKIGQALIFECISAFGKRSRSRRP